MKRWALFFALAGFCSAADTPRVYQGTIYDNRCSDGLCATQCPVSKTPKYTLQTETDAWLLSDQKTPAKFLGKKVTITATASGNNTLKVRSIAALPATQAR